MSRILPRQSRFKVYIITADGKNKTDATDFVADGVSLSMDVNQISQLTLQLKEPELHFEWLRIGYKVEFYGGYIDRDNYYSENQSSPQQGNLFKKLFVGVIRNLNSHYQENGSFLADIVAIDATWVTSSYSNFHLRYPSKNCKRNWANKTQLTLSDIVRGIVSEMKGVKLNLSIGQGVDKTYKLTSPIVQNDMTDWGFLTYLAKLSSCYVWTSVDGADMAINFIEKSKAIGQNNRLEFLWAARYGREFAQENYHAKNQQTGSSPETDKLKANQLRLLSVDIHENPQIVGANVYEITDFNEETGEEETKLVSYSETKDELIYWELDQDKINKEEKTPAGKKKLDKILKMGATSIPRDVFMEYYKKVAFKKGIIGAIDRPFLGVNVKAVSEGDVNIEANQSYTINGISRYSSMRIKSARYFLKGLVHEWSDEGFKTHLDFMR